MHIDINAKNMELTESLDSFIREKLGSLDKFVKRFEDLGEVELKATLERTSAHHYKGEVFRAAADMVLPKKNLHAEAMHEDAHSAIVEVKDRLQQEIEHYKQD